MTRIGGAVLAGLVVACQPAPTTAPRSIERQPPPGTGSPAPASPTPTPEPGPTATPRAGLVIGEFATTIVDPNGPFAADVTVVDRTGLISGISGAIPDTPIDSLVQAPAPEQGLVYSWIVRGCSKSIEISFEPAEIVGTEQDTYRLSVVQHPAEGACLAVELGRSLSIELDRFVPVSHVHLIKGDASFRTVVFANRFRGQYRTEIELLDKTGLVTGVTEASDLADDAGGGISDAVPPDEGVVWFDAPVYCVYRVVMLLEPGAADRYELHTWFDAKWVGSVDCPLAGVGRWALIHLREPIPAANVQLIRERSGSGG